MERQDNIEIALGIKGDASHIKTPTTTKETTTEKPKAKETSNENG